MNCPCGNPAKLKTAKGYVCWTCLRLKQGKPMWLIEMELPADEKVKDCEKACKELPRCQKINRSRRNLV